VLRAHSSAIGRLPIRGMLYPVANMDVRANSVEHLECRFAAKVQYIVRGTMGSKMILRTFAARRSTYFDA
jgi:hypothetical protein